jgi:lipopolysaccharide transport system ATP-binding protein
MGTITVTNLGKAYRQYPMRWSRLAEWIDPRNKPRHKQHWVLQNINFTVNPGEAVGIIGINGAGKSTLLKMITGTTQPTTGNVHITGSVAALLELGMGFHPEFTGRQNVYMASQLRGMSNREIDAKMSEIEDFAEIGEYIDHPVRTYSSGMQIRLSFSVATAVRPDILIVDEALSVGDAYFQHKSFDRIRQFRDQGTTLLFVSHSAGAIKSLCNRAILLDGGIVLRNDSPDAVLDYYNAAIAKQKADYDIKQTEHLTGQIMTRSGSGDATIESVELYVNGEPALAVLSGVEATLRICGKVNAVIDELTVGILIRDRLGNDVFGTNTYHHTLSKKKVVQDESFTVDFNFPALNLGIGSFSITVALHSRDAHVTDNYDWWDRVLVFQVLPSNSATSIGVCYFPLSIHWQTNSVDKETNGTANDKLPLKR